MAGYLLFSRVCVHVRVCLYICMCVYVRFLRCRGMQDSLTLPSLEKSLACILDNRDENVGAAHVLI